LGGGDDGLLVAISDSASQIKPRLPHLKKGTAYCCRIEALRTPCQVTPYDG